MLIRQLFEAKARKVVAVMPGGFHPFHPGHKSLYDWAVKTFGQSNVYVAATNDTKARPFPFEVKKKLAGMAGVPESNFIQVKSPFNNREYADLIDSDTALVFVRSEKDKTEQPLPDQTKKNGEPGYLRSYTGKDLNTSDEMGYMAYGPTINFDFSGMQIKSASELRATWPEMSDEDKLQAAKLMYGNGAEAAVQLLNQALGDPDAPAGESAADGISMANKQMATGVGNASSSIKQYTTPKDAPIPTVNLNAAKQHNKKQQIKPRDPNAQTMQDLRRSGAMGAHKDKKKLAKQGYSKHKGNKFAEGDLVVNKASLRSHIKNIILDAIEKEEDVEKLAALLKFMVGKTIKTRNDRSYTITKDDINEILGFATKRPKQHTVKKRPPEPDEDSVQDKIKKRRALASKIGIDKAFRSDSLKDK